MKYVRLTMMYAVSVAMMMPTGIFAECCCSADKAATCCTVQIPNKASGPSCCSCEQTSFEQEAVCGIPPLGVRVCPSCEDCRARRISSGITVRAKNVDAVQPTFSRLVPVDGDLQQSSAKYIEVTLPVLSHNQRQAFLCVWIH